MRLPSKLILRALKRSKSFHDDSDPISLFVNACRSVLKGNEFEKPHELRRKVSERTITFGDTCQVGNT